VLEAGILRRLRRRRNVARVARVEAASVTFEVEAFDGDRKIGDGTHRRGVVDTAKFKARFGAS
jgi:predicted thioesterase